MQHTKKGFSLVELLIVIGIVAILSVVGYLYVSKSTDQAYSARVKSDITSIEGATQQMKLDQSYYPKPLEYSSTNLWGYHSGNTAQASNTIEGVYNKNSLLSLTGTTQGGGNIFNSSGDKIGMKGNFGQAGKKYLSKDLYDPKVGDIQLSGDPNAKKLIDYGVGRYVYAIYAPGDDLGGGIYYNFAATIKQDGSDFYTTYISGNYDPAICLDPSACPKTLIGSGTGFLVNGQKQNNHTGSLAHNQGIPYPVDRFDGKPMGGGNQPCPNPGDDDCDDDGSNPVIPTFTVTFDTGGGDPVPRSQNILSGRMANEPSTPPSLTGYNFINWYQDPGITVYDFDSLVTSDLTLYAGWQTADCTDDCTPLPIYTYEFQDHDNTLLKTGSVVSGESAVPPTNPTRIGYTFSGWDQSSLTITDNTTFRAQYTPMSYKITFDKNGGVGNMSDQSFLYQEEKELSKNTYTKTGYNFLGWSSTQNGQVEHEDQDNYTFTQTNDITLYAKWEKDEGGEEPQPTSFIVTFDTMGGTPSNWTGSVQSGSTVEEPKDPTNTGYDFSGWFTTQTGGTQFNFETTPITQHTTLYAQWKKSQTGVSGACIGIIPNAIYFNGTNSYSITNGPTLTGSYKTPPTQNTCEFECQAGYAYVTGRLGGSCQIIPYQVNFDGNGGSGHSPTTKNVPPNSPLGTLPNPPSRTGYSFQGWCNSKQKCTIVHSGTLITQNPTTFFAQWKPMSYTITFDGNGGAGHSPTTKQVNHNAPLGALPSTPSFTGSTFRGWFTQKTGGIQVTSATVIIGSATYYAQWDPIIYTITFDGNGGAGHSPSTKTGVYNAFVGSLPSAPNRTGHSFEGWFTTQTGGTQVTPITRITQNITYYAQWKQYTLASCFDFDSATKTITGYHFDDPNCPKNVIIPHQIAGGSVQHIGTGALSPCSNWTNGCQNNGLTSVELPPSLITIGYGGFSQNKILSIKIPPEVRSIGSWSFADGQLTNLSFQGNKVEYIGNYTFYNNKLGEVILPNSITDLGYSAFYTNEITNIQLPSGLTEIKPGLLENNKLTHITIPNTVKEIGDYAFEDNLLTSISLPSQLEKIGDGAFYENSIDGTLNFPTGLTEIGYVAFGGNNIKGISFGPNIRSIDWGAFSQNEISGTITIPPSMEYISDSAFHGNKITSVIVQDGQKNLEIGIQAFAKNEITSISLPSRVNVIGGGAFNQNKLPVTQEWIYARNPNGQIDTTHLVSYGGTKTSFSSLPGGITTLGNYAFANIGITSITIPNTITHIGESTFYQNNLTTITIPNSVERISYGAFNQNNLTKITFLRNQNTQLHGAPFGDQKQGEDFINIAGLMNIDGNIGGVWNRKQTGTNYYWEKIGEETTPIACFQVDQQNHPNTIIGYQSTYNGNLPCPKNVIIPNQISGMPIKKIGNNAFQSKGIIGVSFPNTIEEIEWYAFSQNQISQIVIPPLVTKIEGGIFSRNQINSLTLHSNITHIEEYAFFVNKITQMNLPNGLKKIGSSAFRANSLTGVTIPNSVTEIGGGAFNTNDFHENGSEFIYARTSTGGIDTSILVSYAKRYPINDITIPNTVKQIGDVAFFDNSINSYNSRVIFPTGLTHIGKSAFGYNYLGEISFPNTLKEIGDYAFDGYNYIGSLSLPNSIEKIGKYAFRGNSIQELNLPPNKYIDIGAGAFNYNNLTEGKEWIYARNPNGTTNTGILVSYGGRGYNSSPIPNSIVTIGTGAFRGSYLGSLENFTIPDTVKHIGEYAFSETGLRKVIFGTGLETIASYAFYNNYLDEIEFIGNTSITLGWSPFNYQYQNWSSNDILYDGSFNLNGVYKRIGEVNAWSWVQQ